MTGRSKAFRKPTLTLMLWWIFMGLGIATALALIYLCLPNKALLAQNLGIAQQSPQAHAPQPDKSMETQVLGARLEEMSKRIDEVGAHAGNVLNVIGLLVGFFSIVVAVGLWHAKQYIDRVVEGAELSLGSSLKEQSAAELSKLLAHVAKVSDMLEKLQEQAEGIKTSIDSRSEAVLGTLGIVYANSLERDSRAATQFFERYRRLLYEAANLAQEAAIISGSGRDSLVKKIDDVVWREIQVIRAVFQLESDKEEVVMAGCQTLAAQADRDCLPALELARSRWATNPRVIRQIDAASERLSILPRRSG